MPIYTYVCNECDKKEDDLQFNSTVKEKRKFEGCDKEECQCTKIIDGGVSVKYVGKGFFANDFPKKR